MHQYYVNCLAFAISKTSTYSMCLLHFFYLFLFLLFNFYVCLGIRFLTVIWILVLTINSETNFTQNKSVMAIERNIVIQRLFRLFEECVHVEVEFGIQMVLQIHMFIVSLLDLIHTHITYVIHTFMYIKFFSQHFNYHVKLKSFY